MIDNKEKFNLDVNLDELFSQLSEVLVNPAFSKSSVSFLLLLWGYFEIVNLNTSGEKGGEGRKIGQKLIINPKIIQIENGYDISDQDTVLKTSPGKYYGSYSTGRLLTTVKAMVNLLSKRGAKQVSFSGLPFAERIAWLECKKNNITTHFQPDEKTQFLEVRIKEIDKFREVVHSF